MVETGDTLRIGAALRALVDEAESLGLSVTISHEPLEPLAQGHYLHFIDFSTVRGTAARELEEAHG
jgi:hypothetical protein